MEMDWTKLVNYAGPLAFAAFAGTLLGGIALSFFWKNFGPWKLLEQCKKECLQCQEDREQGQAELLRMQAQISDLSARHELFKEALNRSGLGLRITPNNDGGLG